MYIAKSVIIMTYTVTNIKQYHGLLSILEVAAGRSGLEFVAQYMTHPQSGFFHLLNIKPCM